MGRATYAEWHGSSSADGLTHRTISARSPCNRYSLLRTRCSYVTSRCGVGFSDRSASPSSSGQCSGDPSWGSTPSTYLASVRRRSSNRAVVAPRAKSNRTPVHINPHPPNTVMCQTVHAVASHALHMWHLFLSLAQKSMCTPTHIRTVVRMSNVCLCVRLCVSALECKFQLQKCSLPCMWTEMFRWRDALLDL